MEKVIKVIEEFRILGTDIILEEGDIIQIEEVKRAEDYINTIWYDKTEDMYWVLTDILSKNASQYKFSGSDDPYATYPTHIYSFTMYKTLEDAKQDINEYGGGDTSLSGLENDPSFTLVSKL